MTGTLQLVPVDDSLLPRKVLDFNYIIREYKHLLETKEDKVSISNKNILYVINSDPKAVVLLYKVSDLEKINWQCLSISKKELVYALVFEDTKFYVPLDHIKYLGKLKSFLLLQSKETLVVKEAVRLKDL